MQYYVTIEKTSRQDQMFAYLKLVTNPDQFVRNNQISKHLMKIACCVMLTEEGKGEVLEII